MFARLRAWVARARPVAGHRAPGTGHETAAAGERDSARLTGEKAETAALAQLRAAGLTLLARNYLARGGELDLVMRDGSTLVFVEVRFRADGGHGDGLDSVSTTKQRRLVAAARQFLADHPKYARWTTRFDAIALGAGGPRWVKNVIAIDEAAW